MKRRWHRYVDVATRFGLTISLPKTKVFTAGRDDTGGFLLAVDERHQDQLGPWNCLEHVARFPLLGSWVQADGLTGAEIAARLRSAGEAWGRLRPTCFAGRLLGPVRKFRIFSTFVLSRLLYGAELWRASAQELRPMRTFYNRCIRAIAGHNLFSMEADHVCDADLRGRMGAPQFQQLIDRAVLRWTGHCARMSSNRLPLQLLMGNVQAWPPREYGRPQARDGGRHRLHISHALRRYGVDEALCMDAAQDADRWRNRLRHGWQPNLGARAAAGRDSGDSGSDTVDGRTAGPSDAGAPASDTWPSRTTVIVNGTRAPRDLRCPSCPYRTIFLRRGWARTCTVCTRARRARSRAASGSTCSGAGCASRPQVAWLPRPERLAC